MAGSVAPVSRSLGSGPVAAAAPAAALSLFAAAPAFEAVWLQQAHANNMMAYSGKGDLSKMGDLPLPETQPIEMCRVSISGVKTITYRTRTPTDGFNRRQLGLRFRGNAMLDPRFAYAVPWQPKGLGFCTFGGCLDAESEIDGRYIYQFHWLQPS
ncbi:hypothetical protein F4777DRAFT_255830 [Nemania sp. FL0916]|nr:hypothetical protein F4777DRAFT_255830 [Nemania sp. FL0916]